VAPHPHLQRLRFRLSLRDSLDAQPTTYNYSSKKWKRKYVIYTIRIREVIQEGSLLFWALFGILRMFIGHINKTAIRINGKRGSFHLAGVKLALSPGQRDGAGRPQFASIAQCLWPVLCRHWPQPRLPPRANELNLGSYSYLAAIERFLEKSALRVRFDPSPPFSVPRWFGFS